MVQKDQPGNKVREVFLMKAQDCFAKGLYEVVPVSGTVWRQG